MNRKTEAMVVYPRDVETLLYGWGKINILSSPNLTGAEKFSFGIVEAKPGPGHSLHDHPQSEEVIYVLEGDGELLLENKEPRKLLPGASVFIPPGVRHSTCNTGTGVFKTLIVYAPTGPEAELRQDSECSIIPAGSK